MPLIEQIASDDVIDAAFDWLCLRRIDYSHNNDVWDLRWRWSEIKPTLQADLINGDFLFSPLSRFRTIDAEFIELWDAREALVLKAMSLVLGEHLAPVLSDRCFHLAGNGGVKAAVREAVDSLEPGSFVMKSDVKGYYASIDHHILYQQVGQWVDDKAVMRLIWGYLNRTVCAGGNCYEVKRGISLGCPLSPLMAALYLLPLDQAMASRQDIVYIRFMDLWMLIAPTRWKLRQAVRVVNQTLERLKLEKHPDKTFIGRSSRGLDFLGYSLLPHVIVGPSLPALKHCAARIFQLYEQGADLTRIGEYVRHWCRWYMSGCG